MLAESKHELRADHHGVSQGVSGRGYLVGSQKDHPQAWPNSDRHALTVTLQLVDPQANTVFSNFRQSDSRGSYA
jgi:hypothetical protein